MACDIAGWWWHVQGQGSEVTSDVDDRRELDSDSYPSAMCEGAGAGNPPQTTDSLP